MKVYAPAVVEALAECLRTVYWFKPDLRSFLVRCGVAEDLVAGLPWDAYKREIVRQLMDQLVADRTAGGQSALERLVDGVVEQDDEFPHLAKLDDGRRKVEDAQRAARALKNLVGAKSVVDRAERARQEQRTEADRAREVRKSRTADLRALRDRFQQLVGAADHQRRGYDFQVLLRDLFALHDLDPRGSFARPGEQTDGSLRVDSTLLLAEARWTESQTSPGEVREFRTKVHDKLDNTLGIMISMAGFTADAIAAAGSGGRLLVILMDGQDLSMVFEGLVDLKEMLQRKLRHAAEEGHPLYRIGT